MTPSIEPSSCEIARLFLFDCFTWNNAKNKANDLTIGILFI